jgi:DNA repair protein SbcD/Mre11
MIRMLHFADLHLGVENYGRFDPTSGMNTRVVDFLRRTDEMIAYAKQNEVDLTVFAGDAFKNRQPNPTLQRELAYRIRELAELCPVILLVGNHDLPNITLRAHSLEIYDTLAVPNVLVGDKYNLYEVSTKNGNVWVGTAPYPIRTSLLNEEQAQGKSMAQLDAMLQDQLQLILRDLARDAEQHPEPRVLVGHFTVAGASFGSERNVMVGRDATTLLGDLADPAWDYIALGHIHKHQNLTAKLQGLPPTVYSGSLERVDFGEEADPKGFCWVELERGNTRWQFVRLNARPFVTIKVDVRNAEDPMSVMQQAIRGQDCRDAIVRLIIDAVPETDAKLREGGIHELLRAAGAQSVAGIQHIVERPVRSRLGITPEGMTSLELLRQYLRAKKTSPERIETLLERAEAMMKDE